MRFSLRTLLALALIAALGMLAWRSDRHLWSQQLRAVELALQLNMLEQKLLLDDPVLHQAVMGAVDEYDSLHEIRVLIENEFPRLLEKYGGIDPVDAETFSLRSLPALRSDAGHAPLTYRLLVPEQRPVWLKFGVHETRRDVPFGRNFGSEEELLRESPFEHTGPYEMRLPPGDHVLTVAAKDVVQGFLPLRITLDEQVLMNSAFRSPQVSGSGASAIAGYRQSDFNRSRPLPSLLSVRIYLRDEAGKRTPTSFAFSMWLDEESSGFDEFPAP